MGRFCNNGGDKITNLDISPGNKWQLVSEVPLITHSGFNVKSFLDSEWLTGFAWKVSFLLQLLKFQVKCLHWSIKIMCQRCEEIVVHPATGCVWDQTSEHANKQKPRWTQHRKLDKWSYTSTDVSVHEQLTRVSMKRSADGHENINK